MKRVSIKITKNILLILTICTMAYCAKDEEDQGNCGCSSETIYNVPDESLDIPIDEQKNGLLFFKNSSISDEFYNDAEYNNRFWIIQGDENCYNCYRKFIVCNESALGEKLQDLKNSNRSDSIAVNFSGEAKRLCVSEVILSDYDYKEIILTSINIK